MSLKNVRVADLDADIWTVWNGARQHIEDIDERDEFDVMMEQVEDDDEAWELMEEVIIPYLDDEVAPEGFGFGQHQKSYEWGFWKINPETEEMDLPYPNMIEAEILGEGEEDEPGEKKEVEDIIDKAEGKAEVLDADGRVVGETTYTKENNPNG